jgi:hypothetical protein
LEAVDFFERHGEHPAVAKADDLSVDAAAAGRFHLAEITDGDTGAARLDEKADDLGDLPGPAQRIDAVEFGEVGS